MNNNSSTITSTERWEVYRLWMNALYCPRPTTQTHILVKTSLMMMCHVHRQEKKKRRKEKGEAMDILVWISVLPFSIYRARQTLGGVIVTVPHLRNERAGLTFNGRHSRMAPLLSSALKKSNS